MTQPPDQPEQPPASEPEAASVPNDHYAPAPDPSRAYPGPDEGGFPAMPGVDEGSPGRPGPGYDTAGDDGAPASSAQPAGPVTRAWRAVTGWFTRR